MRYFVWVDFKYEMLAIFLGLVALILVYLAWAGYPQRRREMSAGQIPEGSGHELRTAHDMERNPIPPFLVLIYIIIPIWSLLYFVYYWATGSRV